MKNQEIPSKIFDRIKKMIAHKESAEKIGSIHEAEVFAATIQKLLDQYNLSLGDITVEERMEDFISEDMNHMIPSVGGNTQHDIMRAIAKHNYCRVYLNKGRNGKSYGMTIVGSKENIEVCKYIYNSVKPVFMSIGKDKWKEARERGLFDKGLDTYLRAFLVGCARGLDTKLQEEKNQNIKDEAQLYGLIKVNDAALQQFVDEKFGKIKTVKGKGVSDGGAFHQGVKTGKNVRINKGVEMKSKPVERKLLN